MLVFGALFLSGSIQHDDQGPDPLRDGPLRLGARGLPVVLVLAGYALRRVLRPGRFNFVVAGALVGALGASVAPGLLWWQRLLDAGRGLVLGLLLTGVLMNLDSVGNELLESSTAPWRELIFGLLLITLGSLPSAIFGGALLAVPAIAMGLWVLGRGGWFDGVWVVRGSSGCGWAALRWVLGVLLFLVGLGLAVVSPLISLGLLPAQGR